MYKRFIEIFNSYLPILAFIMIIEAALKAENKIKALIPGHTYP
jgi:hypothetical protein